MKKDRKRVTRRTNRDMRLYSPRRQTNPAGRENRSRRTGKPATGGQDGILDLTTGRQTYQVGRQAGQEGQESAADRENK